MTSAVRRHAVVGLVVALLVGVLAAWLLLGQGRRSALAFRSTREAVSSAQALAGLVTGAGLEGDQVREAVASFVAGDEQIRSARVVLLEGFRLEASTAGADVGEQAAPRRLVKEEKPLYDQVQRLRSAVETNREDQVARKDEIEVVSGEDGSVEVATPLERDGTVVGSILLTSGPPAAAAPAAPLLPAVAALLVPILLMLGLGPVLPEKRWLLTVTALVLLVLGLIGYVAAGARTLAADRAGLEDAVAAHLTSTAAKATAVAGKLSLPGGASEPAAWDVTSFRKPYGVITSTGQVDAGKLKGEQDATVARWRSLFWLPGGVAALLLLFFATGLAARTWQILVANRTAYLYVTPAMLGMLLLVFFPFFYGIALSFTGQTIYNTDKSIPEIWVGLQNFKEIITDYHVATHTPSGWVVNYQNFYWTLYITVVWTIFNVAIGVTVGLILALILNTKGLRFRPIYRVLLILPWAVPNYITALIWKGMFHKQFGVVNQLLQMIHMSPVSWFEKPFSAFLTCLATNGWLSFPFMMVISLGALQSIPADLYEAARVDGASRWRQFRSITLPSLKPALVPAVILSVVWTFNMFNIIYLVSGGDPGHSTEILITQAYKLAFEQYRYGYAAAYSCVIFLILLAYGTWQNRVTKATEGI